MPKAKYTKEEELILKAASKILESKLNKKEKVIKAKKIKKVSKPKVKNEPITDYYDKRKHSLPPRPTEVHIVEKKTSLLDAKENVDVCISFDTTGSMAPCIFQVKKTVQDTVKRLFDDIPNLRISIIAFGDYCDRDTSYVTKTLDFTNDKNKICSFVQSVEKTNGGDCPECYELVLHEARTLNWKAEKNKAIIMIGDDVPHERGYSFRGMYVVNIDWRNETALINSMGINIFGIHCMPQCRSHSKSFYEYISRNTKGKYLTLDQFASINDVLMIVCYKQQGNEFVEVFEKELTSKGRMNRNISKILSTITGKVYKTFKTITGLNPVPTGRFQVLDVGYYDDGVMISKFIEEQGATFNKGRGFYELTKPEKIQGYKEIVLMDKESGDIYNGDEVRTILHLPPQVGQKDMDRQDVKIRPIDLDNWYIFIQSTSFNRKLVGGTRLLYEVSDWKK
jgi:hypothetical protein